MRQHKERIFTYMLIGFIVMQPLLDLAWLNNGAIGEVFGFTIPTLIRITIIVILGIMSFSVFVFHKKHAWLALYLIVIGMYFVMHHINALNFNSCVPGNFNYNMLGEMFYVIRMCFPIAMMYFVYNSNFKRQQFEQSVIGIVLIMSGVVIITNIFKISIGSYSDQRIAGNIFDWFLNPGAYYHNQLASKGFFYVSIVSMVLILLLPYMFYMFIDTKKKRYIGLGIAQVIALFMFGTKATSYSVVLVLGIMCILYLFSSLLKREYVFDAKILAVLFIVVVGSLGMLKYSPATARVHFDEEYEEEMDKEEEEEKEELYAEYDFSSREDIVRFFDNNYKLLSINETILVESYPYKYDPEFWWTFYESTVPSVRMQNRFVQEAVLKRVQKINNNEMDQYLGIGYTRTSNIYNLEKDFLYQYYSMGILGAMLLVGPYIILLLVVMVSMIVSFKKKMTLLNLSLVLGCGLTCCLAYYSGNTLESLGVTIVMGAVYGYLLKNNFRKEL